MNKSLILKNVRAIRIGNEIVWVVYIVIHG